MGMSHAVHNSSSQVPVYRFISKVREALDAGTFSQFRAQFKADRARGV